MKFYQEIMTRPWCGSVWWQNMVWVLRKKEKLAGPVQIYIFVEGVYTVYRVEVNVWFALSMTTHCYFGRREVIRVPGRRTQASRMFFNDILCLGCQIGLLITYWCEHNRPCPYILRSLAKLALARMAIEQNPLPYVVGINHLQLHALAEELFVALLARANGSD